MRALLVVALCACDAVAPPPPPAPPPEVSRVDPRAPVRGSIAVDDDHACAIEATGRVACWGRWLGEAADIEHPTPFELPGLDDVAELAAGPGTTCARTARGAATCCGDDLRPDPVAGVGDLVQLSVADHTACGLRATGQVVCWNPGHGDPARDVGLHDAVEIAGAYGGGAEALCARLRSGEVTCGNSNSRFEAIHELAGATSLAGAGCRFAALLPGHRLATWVGWTGRPMPVMVDGIDADRVVLGGHLNGVAELCVVGAQSRCWAWSNEPLTLSDAAPPPPGTRDLALDTEATCARIGDRAVCRGRLGRLGDGTPEYPRDFVPVPGIPDARQLEASGRTMCALRATGRVVCWGERLRTEDEDPHAVDLAPVELPGVTDAVEIAMQTGDRGDGGMDVAVAVCARRTRGVTCWASRRGRIQASDAPALRSAVTLYSGPTVCGVTATGAVHCMRFESFQNGFPGFSEDDYETYVYAGHGTGAVVREFERRLRRALAAHDQLPGFHTAHTRTATSTWPPLLGAATPGWRPPIDRLPDVVELRRSQWTLGWEYERARGMICARQASGTVACWGERDYLGAGQHSAQDAPVEVHHLVMGPPRPGADPPAVRPRP